MSLYIGLMSGTSMDGIDAALVDASNNTFIHGITRSYNDDIKRQLDELVLSPQCTLGYYSQINTLLGKEFAQATLQLLAESDHSHQEIIAIGSHGQTLCHDTSVRIPYTLQMACPHIIAEMTGITVVADFRTRDVVLGGQGAPFAPIFHQTIFKKVGAPLAVVNVGGIANLTYIKDSEYVMGYDVGPGNCLLDAWIKEQLHVNFDANGEWAAGGEVIEPLLTSLMQDKYFTRKAPKAIGKEYFSLNWLQTHLQSRYRLQDVQRTLLALTAETIANAVKSLLVVPKKLLICGGGVHNTALFNCLSDLLPDVRVKSTQSVKVSPDYLEAMMFAWLAQQTLKNKPLDLTQITGARNPAVLGAIYPAGSKKFN